MWYVSILVFCWLCGMIGVSVFLAFLNMEAGGRFTIPCVIVGLTFALSLGMNFVYRLREQRAREEARDRA